MLILKENVRWRFNCSSKTMNLHHPVCSMGAKELVRQASCVKKFSGDGSTMG